MLYVIFQYGWEPVLIQRILVFSKQYWKNKYVQSYPIRIKLKQIMDKLTFNKRIVILARNMKLPQESSYSFQEAKSSNWQTGNKDIEYYSEDQTFNSENFPVLVWGSAFSSASELPVPSSCTDSASSLVSKTRIT